MLNMWISIGGMVFLILSIGLIAFSRYKLKGVFAIIVSILAYICLFIGGITVLYIVFRGPTI